MTKSAEIMVRGHGVRSAECVEYRAGWSGERRRVSSQMRVRPPARRWTTT